MSNILGYNGAPLALNGAPITCSNTGTDTSEGTITSAAQILYPYVGFSQGVRYVGSIPSQAAQTIYPSTLDQTIASGRYLSGTQTIKGVTVSNLTAANIKNGVTIEIGDSVDSDRIMSVTGTYVGGYKSDFTDIDTTSSAASSITFTVSHTPVFYSVFSNYNISSGRISTIVGWLSATTYCTYIYSSYGRMDFVLSTFDATNSTLTFSVDSSTTSNTNIRFESNVTYYMYYFY